MVMPMNNWTAGIYFLTLYVLPFAVFVYRRRYGRYAKQIRGWRRRMAANPQRPFDLRMLTPAERNTLIGRGGMTSEEWAHAWAADFIAGRRDRTPTCSDYLHEFGKHPKVLHAETRTLVRN